MRHAVCGNNCKCRGSTSNRQPLLRPLVNSHNRHQPYTHSNTHILIFPLTSLDHLPCSCDPFIENLISRIRAKVDSFCSCPFIAQKMVCFEECMMHAYCGPARCCWLAHCLQYQAYVKLGPEQCLFPGTKRRDVDWRTIASKMGVPVPGGAIGATLLACG